MPARFIALGKLLAMESASFQLRIFDLLPEVQRNGRYREQSVAQRTQIEAQFCEESKSLILNRRDSGKKP
jgi:hypothetical protein